MKQTIFTIGHSTRSATEFMGLLRGQRIETVIDVRSKPGSRMYPHFNAEVMKNWLSEGGVTYRHFRSLGGYPAKYHTAVNNYAWRRVHFRDFADYTQSSRFEDGMSALQRWAERARCVIMCSEADPSKCHRTILADNLLVRGWRVVHILGKGRVTPAVLDPRAFVEGTSVTYPAAH